MFNLILNIILLTFFPNSFEEKLETAIISAFPGYYKYEIKIISQKPVGNFIVDNEREIKKNGNLVYVPVKSTDRQAKRNENFITCEVKFFKEVLSAKKDIPRWENLTQDDFELVLTDVSKSDSFIDNYDLLINHRTATFIKKGELLTEDKIEEIPAIKSGDKVVAHSIAGSVDVQLDAICQQDGLIGDFIRIKTKDNKLFKVKVLDNKNVLIVE
ncbi:MAG: hypothetical protein Fur0015_05380 [Ignavibacteriales bacterium]